MMLFFMKYVFLTIILINEKGGLKPLIIKAKINPIKGV
jgi:hypothetical protein